MQRFLGSILMAAMAARAVVADDSRLKKLKDWLRTQISEIARTLDSCCAVRSDDKVAAQVRLFSLKAGKETVLWDCGECWSLAVAGPNLYVLKRDGIWLVHPASSKTPAYSVHEPTTMLGNLQNRPGGLIVFRKGDTADCPYSVELLEAQGAALRASPGLPERCIESISGIDKPDRVHGDEILSESEDRMRILRKKANARYNTVLSLPDDQVNRWDPVWTSEGDVAYLSSGK